MCKLLKVTAICSAMVLLVGCGGGGGDAAPAASTFPIQSALTYAYTNGLQKNLTITGSASDGTVTYPVTGALTLTISGASNTTFNGAAALQTIETVNGSVTINGQSAPLRSTSTAYLTPAYATLAYSTDGSYCEATAPVVYPVSATVGQSGDLGAFACYTDSSKATPTGTETESYVTAAGSVFNTLDVRIMTHIYDSSHILKASGSITYTITSAGLPSLSQFEMTAADAGLTVNISAR